MKIADDVTVPVASIESQAVLKVLAWGDRQATTKKDALDFGHLGRRASGPPPTPGGWGRGPDAAGVATRLWVTKACRRRGETGTIGPSAAARGAGATCLDLRPGPSRRRS